MRDRSLLHINKLTAFTAFAEGRGYRTEPTQGIYEVLRLRKDGPPIIFHKRDRGEHATATGKGLSLVKAFLKERKK